ncbi:hypothetical protein [Tatumella ptyseos]|uniref:Uncharacterized protein n=1 Tax=Tatumella ptyseos TaxID=82987 RepID=A0A2X5NQC7_9GAMM|nr:hypothetical protein [Tatumella ptyseos]SQK75748.1 Uncharacterised protein [Tatumella ptyseos]
MSTVQGITYEHSQHIKFVALINNGKNVVSDNFEEFVTHVSAASGLGTLSVRESAEIFYGPQPKPQVQSLI